LKENDTTRRSAAQGRCLVSRYILSFGQQLPFHILSLSASLPFFLSKFSASLSLPPLLFVHLFPLGGQWMLHVADSLNFSCSFVLSKDFQLLSSTLNLNYTSGKTGPPISFSKCNAYIRNALRASLYIPNPFFISFIQNSSSYHIISIKVRGDIQQDGQ